MLKGFIVFTFIFLQVPSNLAKYSGCSISFPKENDCDQPIMLTEKHSMYHLVIPEKGVLSLKTGETVDLYCPHTRRNHSENTLEVATCVGGETLRIANKQRRFSSLQCKAHPMGSVVVTNSKCGNNQGYQINIGFRIDNKWITLIEVCYDNKEGNAFYAKHTLYRVGIKYGTKNLMRNYVTDASRQRYRPAFHNDGVAEGLLPNDCYKQKTQKKTFTELLGSQRLSNKYVYKNSYLARGHFAPDADFLYPGLKSTSFFYVNTCPQWQVINNGNWMRIETIVRKFAAKLEKPLTIITGSHGILSLPDVNDNPQDIYLGTNKKLPVPKFLWKIVYDETSRKAIAFVAVNNPFIQEIAADDRLCTDVCNMHGWNSYYWENTKKGFVYCCDVNALQKVVRTIPNLNIKGILSA